MITPEDKNNITAKFNHTLRERELRPEVLLQQIALVRSFEVTKMSFLFTTPGSRKHFFFKELLQHQPHCHTDEHSQDVSNLLSELTLLLS